MGDRHVSKFERIEAVKVFKQTIPYDKIAITGNIGINDRAVTLPNVAFWAWQSFGCQYGD